MVSPLPQDSPLPSPWSASSTRTNMSQFPQWLICQLDSILNHHQIFPGWVEDKGVEESDKGGDEKLWGKDPVLEERRRGYGVWRCLAWEKAQPEEWRGKVKFGLNLKTWRYLLRWGVDQALVTRGLLASNLCPLPLNSTLWEKLAVSPSNSSSSLTTSAMSPSKSTSFLPCYQGDERTCDRSRKKRKNCLWWHFHPDQVSFNILEMEENQIENWHFIDFAASCGDEKEILGNIAEIELEWFASSLYNCNNNKKIQRFIIK